MSVVNRLKPEIAKSSLLNEIKRVEASEIVAITDEIPSYAESANESIEEIKTFIRDSIRDICFAEKSNDFDKLYQLLGSTPASIINRIMEIGTTPNTATKYRSQIFAEMEREFNDLDESDFKKRFQYFLKNLRDTVYKSQAMQNLVSEKSKLGNTQFRERKENKTTINPVRLITWSVDILSKVETYTPNYWKPVTQALKMLTGRRTSEILSSGRFVPAAVDGCLLFKGQNKKHSEESFKNEKPILIPIVGGHTELVLQGMMWLDKSGKRQIAKGDTWSAQMTANADVNRLMSGYLTDFCKGSDGLHIKWYELIDAQSDWTNKKKPDCTRDIYTQIMGTGYYELVKRELSATLDFLGVILGHSQNKAVIKYDVDFVVSFDDIRQYVKDIDLKSIPVN